MTTDRSSCPANHADAIFFHEPPAQELLHTMFTLEMISPDECDIFQ